MFYSFGDTDFMFDHSAILLFIMWKLETEY